MSKHPDALREQLREDYTQGDSLQVVAARHGVSKSTASLWTKDLPKHKQAYTHTPRTLIRRAVPHPHGASTKLVGDIAEAAISYELLRRGLKVLKPLGDNLRYDLALDVQGRLVRIQCKTATELTGGSIRILLSSSYAHRGRGRKVYVGEVEMVLAFCYETGEVFAVHGEHLKQKGIQLRRQAHPNGAPTDRWRSAAEFDVDVVLKKFMDQEPNG